MVDKFQLYPNQELLFINRNFKKVKKTNRNVTFLTVITDNGLISIIYKEL